MFLKECISNNENLTHEEYYREVVNALGREEVERLIPFTEKQVSQALLNGDEHLNSLRLIAWDTVHPFLYPLVKDLVRKCAKEKGMTHVTYCFSIAEAVCILKSAAKDRHKRMAAIENFCNA